jgi:hypothetical protein
MSHGDPPIRHHHHQISQAQFEADVPAHAQNDDLSVEVPSFEHIFDRDEPLHLFIIARHSHVCTRADGTVAAAQDDPGYWDLSEPDPAKLDQIKESLDTDGMAAFHRVRLL